MRPECGPSDPGKKRSREPNLLNSTPRDLRTSSVFVEVATPKLVHFIFGDMWVMAFC